MYCCWNSFFLLRFSKPSVLVHVSASSIKISEFGNIGKGSSLEDEVAAVSRRRWYSRLKEEGGGLSFVVSSFGTGERGGPVEGVTSSGAFLRVFFPGGGSGAGDGSSVWGACFERLLVTARPPSRATKDLRPKSPSLRERKSRPLPLIFGCGVNTFFFSLLPDRNLFSLWRETLGFFLKKPSMNSRHSSSSVSPPLLSSCFSPSSSPSSSSSSSSFPLIQRVGR